MHIFSPQEGLGLGRVSLTFEHECSQMLCLFVHSETFSRQYVDGREPFLAVSHGQSLVIHEHNKQDFFLMPAVVSLSADAVLLLKAT